MWTLLIFSNPGKKLIPLMPTLKTIKSYQLSMLSLACSTSQNDFNTLFFFARISAVASSFFYDHMRTCSNTSKNTTQLPLFTVHAPQMLLCVGWKDRVRVCVRANFQCHNVHKKCKEKCPLGIHRAEFTSLHCL